MATVLYYTSPARGHLFPVIGGALELQSRGHEVHIRTLASEVNLVRSFGLKAKSISADVEAHELDDWKAKNPVGALERTMNVFGKRSIPEVQDLNDAIKKTKADILVIDTNSWGAQFAAEASGLPWAAFQPYFTFLPGKGVPPFGPGFARMNGFLGGIRDHLAGKMLFSKMNKAALPAINSVRKGLDLKPFKSITELVDKPDRILYFTAKDFDYPRELWPEHFRFVGPGLWSPVSETPVWLDEKEQPIVLVTCSTERQSDRPILDAALQVLPNQGFFVVATSATYTPEELITSENSNVRIERFIPHDPVVQRAFVVICHGGMGITQRALSHGVPLVVIPFGRDQLEVARRVEYAGVGVRLMPGKLNTKTLSEAVHKASGMKKAAEQMAHALAKTGGDTAAADVIEELVGSHKFTVNS